MLLASFLGGCAIGRDPRDPLEPFNRGVYQFNETLDKAIPARFRRYVTATGYIFTATFCLLFTYLGYRYVFLADTGLYATGGRLAQTGVPDWIQTVAVPIA